MKKSVILLLCLMLLMLCACGAADPAPTWDPELDEDTADDTLPTRIEPDLEAEDAEIRAAMAGENFGMGEKLAVYDEELDQYSYHGAYLPEKLRASAPEEIGAFVSYVPVVVEQPEYGYLLRLRMAFAQNNVREIYVQALDLEELSDFTQLGTPDIPTDHLGMWLENAMQIAAENRGHLLLLERLNRGETLQSGGGTKLLCYDRDAGIYVDQYLIPPQAAQSEAEVGYILSFSSSWTEVSGEYEHLGKVTGRAELLDVEIVDAATGEVLDQTQLGGRAPLLIDYREGSEPGFSEPVSFSEVQEYLQNAGERLGLSWLS